MSLNSDRAVRHQTEHRVTPPDSSVFAVSHPVSRLPPVPSALSTASMPMTVRESDSMVPMPRSAASRVTPSTSSSTPVPPPGYVHTAPTAFQAFQDCVPWWSEQYAALIADASEDTRAHLEKKNETLHRLLSLYPLPYTQIASCFLAFPDDHDALWQQAAAAEDEEDDDGKGVVPHQQQQPCARLTPMPSACSTNNEESEPAADRRIFLGQLHRRHTVGLLRWLFHDILLIPRASVRCIDAHQDHRTGRGKGCAWVTLAADADPAVEERLLALHHHLLFDVHKDVDGVWLVALNDGRVLQRELELRSISEKPPAELSRRLPRGPLVVERPRTRHAVSGASPAAPAVVKPRPVRATHSAPRTTESPVVATTEVPSMTLLTRTVTSESAQNASISPSPSSISPTVPMLPRFPCPAYGTPTADLRTSMSGSSMPSMTTLASRSGVAPPPYSAVVATGSNHCNSLPEILSYHHPNHRHHRESDQEHLARVFRESYLRTSHGSPAVEDASGSEHDEEEQVVTLQSALASSTLSPNKVVCAGGTRYRFNPYAMLVIEQPENSAGSENLTHGVGVVVASSTGAVLWPKLGGVEDPNDNSMSIPHSHDDVTVNTIHDRTVSFGGGGMKSAASSLERTPCAEPRREATASTVMEAAGAMATCAPYPAPPRVIARGRWSGRSGYHDPYGDA